MTTASAMRPRFAYSLAALSGLLYVAAFPGVDWWPLAFVAFVPLLVALEGATPRRAAGLGWTAGFVMTMCGFYWLLPMLRVFGGFPTVVAAPVMALVCAYQAGRIALCGWLTGRATRNGWPWALVFALSFTTSELVFPLLFPWGFGVCIHKVPVLLQVADVGGQIAVGLVLVAVNIGVAELVLARRAGRPVSRLVLAAGLAAPSLALVYGAWRLPSIRAAMNAAEPISVGIVQANMPLFNREAAMGVYARRTQELRERGVGLVVWSELAIPRTYYESSYVNDVPRQVSATLGLPTVLGTTLYSEERGHAVYHNVALMAGEEGRILGRYDKRYLLAFGEYLPLGETFPILYKWSPNSGRYAAGKSLDPFVWNGHRISVFICYEDILPAYVNEIVRHADPDLLVNMTNDAWFGDSNEPWGHMALSKLRAVEHRRYLVRATNSGVSAIIDATGRVIMHGATFREEALSGEVRFMRRRTVYETIGDTPWWLGAAAIAFMAVRRRYGLLNAAGSAEARGA
jgi:apolipoprotein N-acyltransferase